VSRGVVVDGEPYPGVGYQIPGSGGRSGVEKADGPDIGAATGWDVDGVDGRAAAVRLRQRHRCLAGRNGQVTGHHCDVDAARRRGRPARTHRGVVGSQRREDPVRKRRHRQFDDRTAGSDEVGCHRHDGTGVVGVGQPQKIRGDPADTLDAAAQHDVILVAVGADGAQHGADRESGQGGRSAAAGAADSRRSDRRRLRDGIEQCPRNTPWPQAVGA